MSQEPGVRIQESEWATPRCANRSQESEFRISHDEIAYLNPENFYLYD
jgi:hypothetical protein